MGLINFGVPEKETEFLKSNMKLDVFVEGGTYKGGTAKSMSEKFRNVYTIEKSDVMFEIAKENLLYNKMQECDMQRVNGNHIYFATKKQKASFLLKTP